MHTGVSGCGHQLVASDEEGIAVARRYLSYLPSSWREEPPPAEPGRDAAPARRRRERATPVADLIPSDENKPFDMGALIDALVDGGLVHGDPPAWARELIVGFARLDGRALGIVASQPKQKGGVLFSDSADKAARFIQMCNAFNVPLLFLADVRGS